MVVETDRLVLRDFTLGDWPKVLAYQRDRRYLRYYPFVDRTEAEVRAFVQVFVDQQVEQPRRKFQLAITLPPNGHVIGSCGIRRKAENDWEADIGFELAPDFWGCGYATEAARAMVRYGFEELDLRHISSWCIADNAASADVLRKVGMRLEGRLRHNEHFKGRWWNTLLYGVLAGEWQP